MEWFRTYNEARNDAKLDLLTDAEHRVWFRLLCYSADQPERGTIEGVTSRDIGVTSRDRRDMSVTSPKCNLKLAAEVAKGDTELLAQTLEKLIDLEILSWVGTTITFINFKKRQYEKPSDSSEETRRRKAESRARQKAQQTANGHADVTPQKGVSRDVTRCHALDTDTDTEVNEEPTGSSSRAKNDPDGFAEFWTAYPKRTNRKSAVDQWRRLKPDAALQAVILAAIAAQQAGRQWLDGYVPEAARWLRDRRWTDEIESPRPPTPPPIIPPDPVAARRRKLDRLKRGDFEGYTENQTYRGFDGDVRLAADIAKLERELAQGAQA